MVAFAHLPFFSTTSIIMHERLVGFLFEPHVDPSFINSPEHTHPPPTTHAEKRIPPRCLMMMTSPRTLLLVSAVALLCILPPVVEGLEMGEFTVRLELRGWDPSPSSSPSSPCGEIAEHRLRQCPLTHWFFRSRL
jgi:hypothetical protein